MLKFDKTQSFALANRLNKQGEEMKLTKKSLVLASAVALAVGFTGCTQQAAASTGHTKVVKAATPSDLGLYPPNAQPGHCYAKVLIPAKYATKTEKVTVDEGSARLKVIPAKYGYTTKKILVKAASYRLVTIPAQYKTVSRRVLVSPATTEWKRGRGVTTPIAGGGHVTGVNCLVAVPAKYKTVTKRVMVTPPSSKRIPIAAQYKTVRIKTVVEPARTVTLKTPARYSTVTKRVKVSNGYYTWQPVVCRTVLH